MERINATQYIVQKCTSKNSVSYLTVQLDSFTFKVSTRNTKIEQRFLSSDKEKINVFIELQKRITKEGTPYLSIDVYCEDDSDIFSIYCDDKNLAYMFNSFFKNYVYRNLLNDKELKRYGIVL